MKKPVIVWGAGGHALVVADILAASEEYTIEGFLDDLSPKRWGEVFCHSKIIGGKEKLNQIKEKGVQHAVVAIGNCAARLEKIQWLQKEGFLLPVIAHARASIARSASLGEGLVVCAGASIGPLARLGAGALVNTLASVDHECFLGAGVHIGPGAHLGGKTRVGDETWIGLGAAVKDNLQIGKKCIVGIGSVVVDDIPDGVVVYGNPAKVIRKNP